jgi:16S rRNA processing protein RimM
MVDRRGATAWVCVARIVAPHGLYGALKLRCFTEQAADVAAYGPVYDQDGGRRFELTVLGPARGGVVLARAEGIDDRTAAEALRGTELSVPRASLPDLEPDEFYHADLEGLVALRADGVRLGTVRNLENFGAGDLIEIAADDGRVLSLPFDRQTVPVVDLAAGRLVVEPPAELLAPPAAADEPVAEALP